MKKLNKALIAVITLGFVLSPTLAFADRGVGENEVKGKAKLEVKTNFGQFISSLKKTINFEKKERKEDEKEERKSASTSRDYYKDKKDKEKEDKREYKKDKMASTTKSFVPKVLFATTLGLKASSTDLIWVTNRPADSKIWIGTSAAATSSAPLISSTSLSYFHRLSLPNLATSTLYYYTISSTDASGRTVYYTSSFTSASI